MRHALVQQSKCNAIQTQDKAHQDKSGKANHIKARIKGGHRKREAEQQRQNKNPSSACSAQSKQEGGEAHPGQYARPERGKRQRQQGSRKDGQRAKWTVDELAQFRRRLLAINKDSKIFATYYYASQVDLPLGDYLDLIDVVTLWCGPKDVANLEANLNRAEASALRPARVRRDL